MKQIDDPASRSDDKNPELTETSFAKARPAAEVLPQFIGENATQELLRRSRGHAVKAHKKLSQSLHLDPEVLKAYKQSGSG